MKKEDVKEFKVIKCSNTWREDIVAVGMKLTVEKLKSYWNYTLREWDGELNSLNDSLSEQKNDYGYIQFEEVKEQSPKQKYTVTVSDNTIRVKSKQTGNKGTSRCCPTDTFNFGFGVELAKARADGDLELAKKLVDSTYDIARAKVEVEEIVEKVMVGEFLVGDFVLATPRHNEPSCGATYSSYEQFFHNHNLKEYIPNWQCGIGCPGGVYEVVFVGKIISEIGYLLRSTDTDQVYIVHNGYGELSRIDKQTLKVGDKVRFRQDLIVNKKYGKKSEGGLTLFEGGMQRQYDELKFRYLTIKKIYDTEYFGLEEDVSGYVWHPKMFI